MAIFSAGDEGVEAEVEAVAEPNTGLPTARATPSAPYSSRVYNFSDSDSSIETSGGGWRKRRRHLVRLFSARPPPPSTTAPESPDEEEEDEFSDEEEEESESAGEPPAAAADKSEESRMKFTLLDPDVLNCRICFLPLGSPIYQCINGHAACRLCCSNLKNICSDCSMPIGDNRCRALEKFLESMRVACIYSTYGCQEMISFHQRHNHEMSCSYCPCQCPLGCSFLGSFKQLSRHYSEEHPGSGTSFHFNSSKSVCLRFDTKFHVLQEQSGDALFVLTNATDSPGNKLAISCIGPPSKGDYMYELVAKHEQTHLKLQAFTRNIQIPFNDPRSSQYLLIPTGFFCNSPTMKLEFMIKDCKVIR